jgi:MOSC domain-containing protein YiiM
VSLSGCVLSIQVGQTRPLQVGGRKLMSAMGKSAVTSPVAVGPLGLAGDEQADLSVHGGLSKAVYALPCEHLAWWHAQRLSRGVSLFDEALVPGRLGENLSVQGLTEDEVFIGDTWHFAEVVLRVTEPRQPCGKFNAVMGYDQAGRDMVLSGRCGFYLAVDTAGNLSPGETFEVRPGERATSIAVALRHKAWKHLR